MKNFAEIIKVKECKSLRTIPFTPFSKKQVNALLFSVTPFPEKTSELLGLLSEQKIPGGQLQLPPFPN